MPASWIHLGFGILLLFCRHINAKTEGHTLPPVEPGDQLPANARSVVFKGNSHTERVDVVHPVNLTLQCTWTANPSKVDAMTGYWSKDGRDLDNSHTTLRLQNHQYHLRRKLAIKDQESLGRYSCMFGNDAKIDFVLAVPQISDVRDKPIISYVGDSVLLVCKMDDAKPRPQSWFWVKANGTEIADEPQRYDMKNDGRVTTLLVHNLTHSDSCLFHCRAVYAIGTATSHVELKVITIYEPLKPFVAVVVEVLVLVTAILLFERSRAGKREAAASGNETAVHAADPTTTTTTLQGEANGVEEASSARQRKV